MDLTLANDSTNESAEYDSWIEWFCARSGGFFTEVPEEFIEDDFNLTGLANLVPYFREALEMILDIESMDDMLLDEPLISQSAELLYGLIHQRYILTLGGLEDMMNKFEHGDFGTCPRVYCRQSFVVPCGRYDFPGLDTVKVFCPLCQDIYNPTSSRYATIDGAYFGSTFPHLLFDTYPELVPSPSVNKVYEARIFGFRVSPKSKSGPRMGWLRQRPLDASELDSFESEEREDGNEGDEEEDRKEDEDMWDESEAELEEEPGEKDVEGGGGENRRLSPTQVIDGGAYRYEKEAPNQGQPIPSRPLPNSRQPFGPLESIGSPVDPHSPLTPPISIIESPNKSHRHLDSPTSLSRGFMM
ncbi:uncharacterized protein VTP21DRAFT_3864 [Calcarisporiella thermophila]|uniref:uncharacterized protein n=1 Tax=Calcarisporiella thermophila TaxID=911321 RepID=UPI003742C016